MGSAWVVALALLFLALHLPYLPRSLEDLDSINFALGVRQFDVARHQPHPPGYPVYIALGKTMHAFVSDEARALGLLSVIAGALGVLGIGALYHRIDGAAAANRWTAAGTALAVTSPLYWFTAARPLSDMTGLAAAVAVQAATLAAASPRAVAGAAFAAGLASGLRSQVAWLTAPLLIVRVLVARRWGLGAALPMRASTNRRAPGTQLPAICAVMFLAGVLLWFLPLVLIAGGPGAYWRALSNQGAEDLGNISMLWTTHSVRAAADASYYRFVAPWATAPVATLMLALAAIGLLLLARRDRRALMALTAAFGPYLVFDLLFQETFTGRYALPLVLPMAYLATRALRWLPRQSGLLVAVAVSMFDAHVSGTSIATFARDKAPAFRLLDDMAEAARSGLQPPVVAMDRRNMFDFRRPIVWADGALPAFGRQLAAPPQHEWLEAVKYWNDGGRAPIWFVVDPKRAAIDLVQHGDPARYRWPLPYPDLVSGSRPNEMDWYRVDRPEWYVGEGWALTPEAAGVAETDHRGLEYGPISASIAPTRSGGRVMIGGRNFESTRRARLSVLINGTSIREEALAPGPFLFFLTVPPSADNRRFDTLTLEGDSGSRVAIEQFDASAFRWLTGFGSGWHEQEFNPRTGARWRWLSERGELRRSRAEGEGPPRQSSSPRVALHIEGESPRKYFSRGSRLVITSKGVALFDRVLVDDFSIDVPIANVDDPVVFETDQIYVPAERSRRTQDRRHLGLRVFTVKVYGPGTAESSPPAR